jgi:hypothetical protein
MTDDFSIGYECGCFDKWLRFIHRKDPSAKIETMSWGARIYFSRGEDGAKELAREFVVYRDAEVVQFT